MNNHLTRGLNEFCLCPAIMSLTLLVHVAVFLLLVATSSAIPPPPQGSLLYYSDVGGKPYTVKYDKRSFQIDGKRSLLLGGSVHYPRVVEDEWATIFAKMREDGLNMIQTYLFWNIHEPVRGQEYDMAGNKNWTRFVELAGKAGLFVTLRVGPFVAAEWDYGGIPFWVNRIPGMVVRSNNDPWKKEMQRFVLDMMDLARPLLAPQGGPIIIAQIENEFRWKDAGYIDWCGRLVDKIDAGIPWIMCNGASASNTINTCNGNDCAEYAEEHSTKYPGQPLGWTENEGWYQAWTTQPNTDHDNRPASEMAYVVMKWIARGGSYHNYYMWYGGNNFGRKAAGSCITTMYADGVNLHSDGLPNEPKKSHLKELHQLLSLMNPVLMLCAIPDKQYIEVYDLKSKEFVPSTKQFVFPYQTVSMYGSLYFIENSDKDYALVRYKEKEYSLAGMSSIMLDSVGATQYNSSKVNTAGVSTKRVVTPVKSGFNWTVWPDNGQVPSLSHQHSIKLSPAGQSTEQLNLTDDLTDFVYYKTWLGVGVVGTLTIPSTESNVFEMYIDDYHQSTALSCHHGSVTKKDYSFKINNYSNFTVTLVLASISLGVTTHTEPGDRDMKGIIGTVTLGNQSLGGWEIQVGLKGESLKVYTKEGMEKVKWSNESYMLVNSMQWYKAVFDSVHVPYGKSLLLDMDGMIRGFIYLNGFNLGRYWLSKPDSGGTDYVQQYYYVPPSLLLPFDNLLVLFEEEGSPHPEHVQLVLASME